MAKDRSDEDLVDEARHDAIIEQEERIHREHPILVKENADLKKQVADLQSLIASKNALIKLKADLLTVEMGRTRSLTSTVEELKERIEGLEARIKEQPKDEGLRTAHRFTSSVCSFCHERIIWGKTKIGKFIPLQTQPVTGEVISWSRDLEATLKEKGIVVRQGYDEMGEQVTVAIVNDPNPLMARTVYPVHFPFCKGRNLSAGGVAEPT